VNGNHLMVGGNVRAMHSMVTRLRRKLGRDVGKPTYIVTGPRIGFQMPRGRVGVRNSTPLPERRAATRGRSNVREAGTVPMPYAQREIGSRKRPHLLSNRVRRAS